jgi:hypothetical protein
MSSKKKASDILERMRSTAVRDKPVSRSTDSTSIEATQAPEEPEKKVRFTLDLAKDQHKFLKMFALEAETDASAVMRVLLNRLEKDSDLAIKVKAELSS